MLRAKKHAKMKKRQSELGETLQMNSENKSTSSECEPEKSASQKNNQVNRRPFNFSNWDISFICFCKITKEENVRS